MKVLVFTYNKMLGIPNIQDIKASILTQLKDGTGLVIIDDRVKLQGVIELEEKDCKQFGVVFGSMGERGNH